VTADATSTIAIKLQNKTTLTGSVQHAAITLDNSSIWTVTADSSVTTISDSQLSGRHIANIVGNGHTVQYDSTLQANASLGNRTYRLSGGGLLVPSRAGPANNNANNTPGSNNQNGNTPGNTGNSGGRGFGRR
jgi:hypothetical protein